MYFPSGLGAVATPAASGAPPAAQLQNALRALGTTSGDPVLMAVTVDGVVGPKTVSAVNRALSQYIGSTPQFPRADLTVDKVRQYAGALAALVAQRVQKSGGTLPAAVIKRAAPRALRLPTGNLPAVTPEFSMQPTQQTKIVWYAIGGLGVLLLLVGVADAMKRRKKAA